MIFNFNVTSRFGDLPPPHVTNRHVFATVNRKIVTRPISSALSHDRNERQRQ
jgi:hypothetical protein